MKKQKKIIFERYWYIVLILAFPALFWIGKNNQEIDEKINKSGMSTVGTVYNRLEYRGESPGNKNYGLKFDFFIGDSLIRNISYRATQEEYQNAIVGMKYRVKYLTDEPNFNSIIYVDQPIDSEFVNIENERNRIMTTYKNARTMLEKNARELEDLGLK